MQILIVRHAIAEDRLAYAASRQPDELRPLTTEGKQRMRRGAMGLQQILPAVDYLISSPLIRAIQTSDILQDSYPKAERQQWEELSPGVNLDWIKDRLAQLREDAVVALVGHEPDLAALMAWLTTGEETAYMHLKKGSALLLETPGFPRAGNASLLWALTPRQLRSLATQ